MSCSKHSPTLHIRYGSIFPQFLCAVKFASFVEKLIKMNASVPTEVWNIVISCLFQIVDPDSFAKYLLRENMQYLPGGRIESVPSLYSVLLPNTTGFIFLFFNLQILNKTKGLKFLKSDLVTFPYISIRNKSWIK